MPLASGVCLCLGRRAGVDCKRRPAAELAIYRDPSTDQLWGLCGRARCARAYNGVESSADVRAALDVRAVESKPAAPGNRFAALLKGGHRVEKKSKALKWWNRQARERAREGECCAINCRRPVEKGKAWCSEHA